MSTSPQSAPSERGERPHEGGEINRNIPAKPEKADESALRQLQEMHGPVLLSYLTRLTGGDVHRAEDILQETLLRAWNNPSARCADGKWSRAWLFTVARRITIDQVRAVQARAPEYFDERIGDHAMADDQIERLLDDREVRAAVSALQERHRATLVEIFFHQRSVAETAEILNIPPGTVKSRTFYALQALQAALIGRGFDFRQPAPHQASTGHDTTAQSSAAKKPRRS